MIITHNRVTGLVDLVGIGFVLLMAACAVVVVILNRRFLKGGPYKDYMFEDHDAWSVYKWMLPPEVEREEEREEEKQVR